jgi:AraC-like DNA-binding protein
VILERIDELGKSTGIPESFGLFRGILERLTRAVERERHDRRLSLAAEMQQYVRANMPNLALNRYLVATEFGMNETYFSEFFHRQTGDTFSDYLEKSRIDKALELMKGGDTTIVDIAREVGYSNDKVFRRAFKRVMGVSPGSYREMNARGRVGSAAGG